jgi:GH15 family glucan-1,4-alpha-glucosidase
VRGTLKVIQEKLVRDGLVYRYLATKTAEQESAFLPCSFWLVQNLARTGQRSEAEHLFERLLGLCNGVGLLSEEYDSSHGRFLGNFPQALSHIALINAGRALSSS